MLKRAIRAPVAWSNVIFLDGASWPVLDAVARQTWFDVFEEELRTDGEGPVPAPICRWQEDAIENASECWRTQARCLNQDCSRMKGTPREEAVRKGDQWTILTRSMVKYSVFGKEAQEWYDFFRDTAVPDEHFFATIKYAQPGAPKGWLRIPMYVDWVQPCKSHPVSPDISTLFLSFETAHSFFTRFSSSSGRMESRPPLQSRYEGLRGYQSLDRHVCSKDPLE